MKRPLVRLAVALTPLSLCNSPDCVCVCVTERDTCGWVIRLFLILILDAAFILRARVFYAIYVCVVRGVATVYTDGACARPNPLAGGRALI